MDDLVKIARNHASNPDGYYMEDWAKMADRIEELERALRKTYTVLLMASLYRGYEGGPLDEPSTAHVVREAKLALGEKKDG
jgi:hypothetical protein